MDRKKSQAVITPIETAVSAEEGWTLYILECSDRTFYTGITKDIGRRLLQHNDGRASRYTRVRTPVKLLYQEPCRSRSEASIKEAAIKSLSRKEKERMIRGNVSLRPSIKEIGDPKG
jgi:putative endonuclease